MEYALLAARVLLAAVFLIAGLGKLLDLRGSKAAMQGFGLPASLAGPAAIILPLVEIVTAVLLIPKDTAWYGAILAAVLLGLFVIGIAYNMARGRHPDCHCFGQIHSEPAGIRTLVRNIALGAVAVFIVLYGTDRFSFSHGDAGYSLLGWMGDLSTWEIVVTVVGVLALLVIAAEAYLLVHLLGQNGRVLLRLDALEAGATGAPDAAEAQPAVEAPPAGLPVGSPAPAFKLEGLHGEVLTLDALRAAGKSTMLIFSDPGCGPCNALLPDIAKWQRDFTSRLNIALISSGTADANKSKVAEHGLSQVLLQTDRQVSNQYQAYGTPSAVVVSKDGLIESSVAGGADAIRQLVTKTTGTVAMKAAAPNRAAQAPPQAPAPAPQAPPAAPSGNGAPAAAPQRPSRVGEVAPAVSLPDLSGKTVSVADFKGSKAMLLFWNPGCGFCRKMTDELKQWEANPPKDSPKLLIVSTGTVEANQAMGLSSTTVLDEGFQTGRAFGASGTPSAILIDASGKIASEVAVGGPNVMALATGKQPAPQEAQPQAPASKKGQAAPEVKLKDIDGAEFDLASRKGRKTMLLFWNPGCGFCKRMTDDLRNWLSAKPRSAPDVVLVTTGTVEVNREQNIPATLLMDEGFSVGRKFGAGGTPSAILVDEKGMIASDVAVGAPAVLALAGQQPVSA
jgi:peroxiredoxin/uncharacterized membrane protein YphA (DoxX/SURF4 family)